MPTHRLLTMAAYYTTLAIRNLRRHRLTSAINISGLGIGIGCCLLAIVFIRYHLSWDEHHTKADRIYRVLWESPERDDVSIRTSGPVAPALEEAFPEIEKAVRLFADYWPGWLVSDEGAVKINLRVTDPNIFDIFDLPISKGDPETIFTTPNSIAITEAAAQRFFQTLDVIGQQVTLEAYMHTGDYTITGILKDPPDNAMLRKLDFLTTTRLGTVSIEQKQQRSESGLWWDKWSTSGFRGMENFLLLKSPEDAAALTAKLPAFIEQTMGAEAAAKHRYTLQPLSDIHTHGERYGLRSDTPFKSISLVGGISVIILLVACINFVNLSTARARVRQREIGIRKASGAQSGHIVAQFMFESLATTVLATVIGIAFAKLSAPTFAAHGGFTIPDVSMGGTTGLLLAALVLGVALLAGAYPALFVSTFHPVRALKSDAASDGGRGMLHRWLPVGQFAACILLVLSTVVMYGQTRHLMAQDLGFDHDLIITMPIFMMDRDRKPDWGKHLSYHWQGMKKEVLEHPDIIAASALAGMPGVRGASSTRFESDGQTIQMPLIRTDEDYIKFLGLEITRGRDFKRSRPGRDISNAKTDFDIILNESAVKQLGWTDPIGKPFNMRNGGFQPDGVIVGVVKDFHVANLRQPIRPLAIIYSIHVIAHLGVKVRPERLDETIAFLKEFWERKLPERPFQYEFLDDRIGRLYRSEMQTAALMNDFSILGILLGCMGLFGLTAFVVERRTREVGIRKSLGASVTDIVYRLSKESGVSLLAANVVAWPIGYMLLQEWLQQFVYQIDLHVGYFVLAGSATAIAALAALVTVCLQTLPAARANPVEALRHE